MTTIGWSPGDRFGSKTFKNKEDSGGRVPCEPPESRGRGGPPPELFGPPIPFPPAWMSLLRTPGSCYPANFIRSTICSEICSASDRVLPDEQICACTNPVPMPSIEV